MEHGAHDPLLVVLSVLIAVLSSYTALDLAARVRVAKRRFASLSWLAAASFCMGGGIWAMHFVAMLAYSMPGMEIVYDPQLTALSLLIAILLTAVGFSIVARPDSQNAHLLLGGLCMGLGVVGMHYTGMAAMRMQAIIRYDVVWVCLSVLVALGASIAALWLAFKRTSIVHKGIAAIAMGLAVAGMHYIGMIAATFEPGSPSSSGSGFALVGQGSLALGVSSITFLILFSGIIAAMFDRQFAHLVEREAIALRRSEEQFRALYRRTPLPLHALDAAGKIQEVSDAWLELMGYNREEVYGRAFIEFMTARSADRRTQDWKLLFDRGLLVGREYNLITKDGRILDVLSTSRVERGSDGSFLRVVGGLTDVTERRRTEEALRQSQKMEIVGQLAGGIAHDFNNILGVVTGNLDLLRRRVVDQPEVLRFVEHASEATRRGAALSQRMLSFSRQHTVEPTALRIAELLRGMEDLLARSLGPDIIIRFELQPKVPLVIADHHQLEMVILNLAINARDAMAGKGPLTISVETVSCPQATDAAFVAVAIDDRGTGMDAATLARASEPFFTTKGIGKGTGLGLSMARRFAEESGGSLAIESELGQGTKITILLPSHRGGTD